MLNEGPLGLLSVQWTYLLANTSKVIDCSVNVFNCYTKGWCGFINTDLQPSSQRSEIITDWVILLYYIYVGLCINIPAIMHHSINHIAAGTINVALGFGYLIINLCAQAGVSMSEDESTLHLENIDTACINIWEEWYSRGVCVACLGWDINRNDPDLLLLLTRLLQRVCSHGGTGLWNMQSNDNIGVRLPAEARRLSPMLVPPLMSHWP